MLLFPHFVEQNYASWMKYFLSKNKNKNIITLQMGVIRVFWPLLFWSLPHFKGNNSLEIFEVLISNLFLWKLLKSHDLGCRIQIHGTNNIPDNSENSTWKLWELPDVTNVMVMTNHIQPVITRSSKRNMINVKLN